jgi:hypothetical protein
MNILPFKKPTHIGNIMISVKYDVLEDGTVWYCWKLGEHWSEWEELEGE